MPYVRRMLVHMYGIADDLAEQTLAGGGRRWCEELIAVLGAADRKERTRAMAARATQDDP